VQRAYGKRIALFDATPKGVVCPHFYELRWARGCPLSCSWCYLQLTLRIQGTRPECYPLDEVEKSLRLFFRKVQEPHLLNSGETSDSLMFPRVMERIADMFEAQNRHKLLILSKLAKPRNVEWLLEKPRRQTVVSFSINAAEVAERFERGAPPPRRRIREAARLKRAGYEVRLRIDPIIPLDPSYAIYEELLEDVFSSLRPDRITLGTLRVYPGLLRFASDEDWVGYLDRGRRCVDGRYRMSEEERVKAYLKVMDYAGRRFGYEAFSLCKETEEVWRRLWMEGLKPRRNACNCVL